MLVSSVWAGACSNLTNRTASDGTIDFILFAHQFILYLLSIKTSLAKSSFSCCGKADNNSNLYLYDKSQRKTEDQK